MTLPANKPENMIRRLRRARKFGENTCPASRHVQIMAEALSQGQPYSMIAEEPEHCGRSLLSVVESLFKARNLLIKHGIDPWSGVPIGSKEYEAHRKRQIETAQRALS